MIKDGQTHQISQSNTAEYRRLGCLNKLSVSFLKIVAPDTRR